MIKSMGCHLLPRLHNLAKMGNGNCSVSLRHNSLKGVFSLREREVKLLKLMTNSGGSGACPTVNRPQPALYYEVDPIV